jgi:hypothetical protein
MLQNFTTGEFKTFGGLTEPDHGFKSKQMTTNFKDIGDIIY